MRVSNYSSLLLLSLILTACGGGGDSSSHSTQAQGGSNNQPSSGSTGSTGNTGNSSGSTGSTGGTTTTDNTPRVIDYYGDSTVRGCETDTNCQGQAPETAPQAFDAALPATPTHTVSNQGVDGTTACQLLNGTDGVHPAWEQQMTNTPATTHVIINHGINDSFTTTSGESVANYQQCLTQLVQVAKAHNKQVLLETPNPISQGDLTPYVNAMKTVAQNFQVPVIDQFTYLLNKYGSASAIVGNDGLHPRDAVYVAKGRFAAKAFQQACANFTCTYMVVSN